MRNITVRTPSRKPSRRVLKEVRVSEADSRDHPSDHNDTGASTSLWSSTDGLAVALERLDLLGEVGDQLVRHLERA
jgi:hypothetical protein